MVEFIIIGNDKIEVKTMNNNNKSERFFLIVRTIGTGFIGGLICSLIGMLMNYFNFSDITLRSYVDLPGLNLDSLNTVLIYIISIIIISLFSVLLALVYFLFFKKINTLWMGVFYGILIWIILFLLIHPVYPNIQNLKELGKDTIVSTICLFIFYGLFIGYSISYDYDDTVSKRN